MEIVDVRHFTDRDFAALLAAESRAWNDSLLWDYTASAQLVASSLADKRLAGYALLEDGRLSGYSFYVYEGEKGLIGNLFVQPSGSQIDGVSLLLENAVSTLQATPGITRVEAQLPHYEVAQLQPYFSRHGFESFDRRFMVRHLEAPGHHSVPRHDPSGASLPPAPPGFVVEPWQRRHDRAAEHLLYDAYRSHVDGRVNDQYQSIAGTSRLLENILHLRGCGDHLASASFVALHQSTHRLAGILALSAIRSRTAHIPQVAVSPAFQGQGVGTALLKASFHELGRLGFSEVTLTVTEQNSGALRLYERLGFETRHRFGAYVWEKESAAA